MSELFIFLIASSQLVSQELYGIETYPAYGEGRTVVYSDTSIFDGYIEPTFRNQDGVWSWSFANEWGSIRNESQFAKEEWTVQGGGKVLVIRPRFRGDVVQFRISGAQDFFVSRVYDSAGCEWITEANNTTIMEITCFENDYLRLDIFESTDIELAAAERIAIVFAVMLTMMHH